MNILGNDLTNEGKSLVSTNQVLYNKVVEARMNCILFLDTLNTCLPAPDSANSKPILQNETTERLHRIATEIKRRS